MYEAAEKVTHIEVPRSLLDTDFVGWDFIDKLEVAYEEAGLLAHKFNDAADVIPGNAFTVYFLSDNGGQDDDLAKKEIKKRLQDHSKQISVLAKQSAPELEYSDIPAQDAIAGAFDLAQITRDSVRGIGNVIFLNCAPRKNQRGQHDNNQGEQVYTGMLRDGTIISAVGEESFTFFHDLIESGDLELYKGNVQTNGSQFRSRDFFPLYSLILTHQIRQFANESEWKADLSVAQRKELLGKLGAVDTGTVLDIKYISKPSDNPAVVRYDTHGNLKLNVRAKDFEDGTFKGAVQFEINGKSVDIELGKSMFQEGAGKLSFSEGSTGQWDDYKRRKNEFNDAADAFASDGEWSVDKDGFLQIAVINGSAKEYFGVSDIQLRSDKGVPVSITRAVIVQPAAEREFVAAPA